MTEDVKEKILARVATAKGLEFLGMVEEAIINDENYIEACAMWEAMKLFEIQYQSVDEQGNAGINLTTMCQPFGDIDSPTSINGICAINIASAGDKKMYQDTFKRLKIQKSGLIIPDRGIQAVR